MEVAMGDQKRCPFQIWPSIKKSSLALDGISGYAKIVLPLSESIHSSCLRGYQIDGDLICFLLGGSVVRLCVKCCWAEFDWFGSWQVESPPI